MFQPWCPNLRSFAFLPLVVLALGLVSGCAPAVNRHAVPKELVPEAQIAEMHKIRFWGDHVDPEFQKDFYQTVREHPVLADPQSEAGPGYGVLVLSGGGDAGAYGAGILCGWTERGDRPRFRIVTGVSTGALIAPFAFLGPKYDDTLRFYTKVSADQILEKRYLIDLLRYDSAYESRPLQKTLEKMITPQLMQDMATEQAKGRRLYVQTVNLDAQRPVVWDMGAIAASGKPNAIDLFRQVLLASASIPGAFPPQYIQVEAQGKKFDEMHVDGGVASQMLMTTLPIDMTSIRDHANAVQQLQPRVYVIRNAVIRPEWDRVTPKLFPIAGRAISSIIKSQGQIELRLMYLEAKQGEVDFNLAYIPDNYQRKNPDEFNTEEMNRMFKLGHDQILANTVWLKTPPRYADDQILKPRIVDAEAATQASTQPTTAPK